MDKQELLGQMAELVALQERAIQEHPVKTATAYEKGRDAFIEGQGATTDTEWSRSMALSLDELSLMHRYMLSSSFISAWYQLSGEKPKRDQAADSCSLLVSGLGLDPEQVMGRYIQYEQLWRRTMKHGGIAPNRVASWALVIALFVVAVVLALLWNS